MDLSRGLSALALDVTAQCPSLAWLTCLGMPSAYREGKQQSMDQWPLAQHKKAEEAAVNWEAMNVRLATIHLVLVWRGPFEGKSTNL